jgi:tetratricopeptide (TPR) repeat protein
MRFIKAGHQLIAKEALRYYSRYPKVVFEEILEAADEENLVHWRYIVHLIRAILVEGQEISKEYIKDVIIKSEKIAHILRNASISELNLWIYIYKQLNLQKETKICAEEILLRTPNTSHDCQLLVGELLNKGLINKAFSAIRDWLDGHSADRMIFMRYHSLVKDKGTKEQIKEVIEETSLWLKDHPEDYTIRGSYLLLVKDKGTKEQIKEVIEETSLWLKDHPEDYHVGGSYLLLVKDKGTKEQIKEVIEETSLWLKDHLGDYTVRVSYLSLVKDKGSKEQIEEVIEETSLWLKDHLGDYTVRGSYLLLVKDKGTKEQIKEVIEETSLWLKDHPEDYHVRGSYLLLVKDKGSQEQIKEVIEETTKWWLQNHPDDNVFHEVWLVSIRDKGNREQKRKGMEDTISWLKDHPEDNKIRSVYLSLVIEKCFLKEYIRLALEDTEQWMKKHGTHPLFRDYLPLIGKIIKTEIDMDIDIELVKQFGYEFINSCKWEYNIWPIKAFADWLRSEKFFDEAEQIYESLIKIKIRNRRSRSGIYFGYGKMFLGQATNLEFTYEDRLKKLKRAEEKFRDAIKIHKGHHMAHSFLAITLKELGEDKEAKKEFGVAEWWAPFDEKGKMVFIQSIPSRLELKNILDNYIIPNEIKDIFEAEGKTLSKNAFVKKKKKIKNRWVIKDSESYYLIIEEKMGSDIAKLSIYGDYHPGRLPYKIGNVYLTFNRYEEAIFWLKIAIREEPENFANWWKSGYAKIKLAFDLEEIKSREETKYLLVEALSDLETAWKKAPKPLQLPASKEIPEQITECKKYLYS